MRLYEVKSCVIELPRLSRQAQGFFKENITISSRRYIIWRMWRSTGFGIRLSCIGRMRGFFVLLTISDKYAIIEVLLITTNSMAEENPLDLALENRNLKIENTKLKESIAYLKGKIEGLEMVIDKFNKN